MEALKRIPYDEYELIDRPMAHHKAGLQWTVTGYGSKIPTTKMLQWKKTNRLYRVYCMIYSNSGSCYIIHGGEVYFVDC